ncbi:8-amino-7-oxononanoate synthase/2-amino-3-ketobutyrate coenzyme A ligase [Bacillus subtilis]|jgi:glycine C-acetyltransferase|uniref:glycine C-acetyltransferase n=1 Tax=Bacillus subtilis TaxID=1423 RepID=UPI0006A91A37|nr:glycine C-acetyltransferase [Bacillus subtilis]QNK38469.1 glycine C-acetyltransferase [Bacillus subtilis subsp. subtilis]RPK01114.1 2-amino-3-ketobutyrate coenzyme A ligase [Bacillus subtilis]RPK10494.1 2-amino-3-ketobutyrate coenzyme A ligase [Bacillus subtilis]RUS07192.1 2-amino-3-ketobutyrate coenzyme A ligase [Bacillus subtilis]CUB22308.1 8-amino-7-oxononanoate synthase/2-amino-3-ketobutyrate coenzyme A ligase [Bacillus subtilis]
MTKEFEFLKAELDSMKENHTWQDIKQLESMQGPSVTVNHQKVIQLSSNNYLGFTSHPRLINAAQEAVQQYGAGTGSVRTIAGTFTMHQELEKKLAAFKKTEAALVFQSGFTTNQGVLSSILSKEDIVISDELNHASIIDGIRLTKADKKVYQHVNMSDLERVLRKSMNYRMRLIVTDGVFSMDGNIAPLPDIVELAEKYDAFVMVDDAHASGVLGENGRGTVNHFGLDGRVHIQVGTLSKAIGVLGGYAAGSKVLIDYLRHKGRPFLFSTSHPPAVTAACMEAIDVLLEEPEHMERLWENTVYFKAMLVKMGLTLTKSETPILPILIGDEGVAKQFSDQLLSHGVFAQSIVFPTVAKGKARIRTIITAEHTKDELDQALDVIEKTAKELQLL